MELKIHKINLPTNSTLDKDSKIEVEVEVKNEYLTLLKLSNYNYKVALAELIKTERDKDLMKLLLESNKDKK